MNPKFHGDDHPLSGLPGVGVAYKVVEALYTEAGRFDELEGFLDLVALGIVADLAIQRGDTRHLLQRGLAVLRDTERPGLQAIMENGGVQAGFVKDEDIGFQLGPRLNAVGRLADANVSVPLLTTTDYERAREIARTAGAAQRGPEVRDVGGVRLGDGADPAGAVAAAVRGACDGESPLAPGSHWDRGESAGGGVREADHSLRGTSWSGGTRVRTVCRGATTSRRQSPRRKRCCCHSGDIRWPRGFLSKPHNLEAFRRGVSKAIIEQRDGRGPEPTLDIEVELSLRELTMETALHLEVLAPFGPGNPPVNILCRRVQVEEDKRIGKDMTHRKLVVRDDTSQTAEMLWWGGTGEQLPEDWLDVVVRLRPGFFIGRQTVTVALQDFRIAGETTVGEAAVSLDVIDCRVEPAKGERLAQILDQEAGTQVWGEVLKEDGMRPRGQMEPSESLVVWTSPPDRKVLAKVLRRVQPQRVYVFGVDPEVDEYYQFMERLAGLVKLHAGAVRGANYAISDGRCHGAQRGGGRGRVGGVTGDGGEGCAEEGRVR